MNYKIARLLAPAVVMLAGVAGLGCKDKACLRWDDTDRAAYAATSTSTSSTSGGAGGAGGGSTTVPLTDLCPNRETAKKLLGNPSCAESIESIDSEGEFEDDSCCYEVSTKSKACPSGAAE